MKTFQSFASTLLLLGSAAQTLHAGELLPVMNPTFANVPIQCAVGYSYQSLDGATCTSQPFPAQAFNGAPRIGWVLTPHVAGGPGVGVTRPGTLFNPPPFTGLPFSQAAFLQGAYSEVSQTISGFVAQEPYRLAFYLGSRYASGSYDGNQTVIALIDDHIVDEWSLVSNTPFTLRNVLLKVASSGPHTLKFVGTASGDHTAFLSGVTLEALE